MPRIRPISLILIFVEVGCAVDYNVAMTGYFGLQEDYNFGHSGYVTLLSNPNPPLISISKCQYYDVNKTVCDFIANVPQNVSDVPLLKAWAAITLRDNIVTVLGILAHSKSISLPQDVYTSLYFLYQQVQRHNIKTMELFPMLRSIASESGTNRVMMLFKELNNVMPSYCKAAVEEVTKAFTKMKDKFTYILGSGVPGGGGGVVDLLQDLDPFLLLALRAKNPPKIYDKRVESFHGKEFAMFFAGITDGRISFTQPVLAALMLNLRYSAMPPEVVEDLRYLGDVLRDNMIKDWTPYVKSGSTIRDPYAFVRSKLTKLSLVPGLDDRVTDIVNNMIPKIVKPPDTYANPHYEEMIPFFGTPELDTILLLNRTMKEGDSSELTSLKQNINKDKIDMSFALKGFIRFDYDSPRALLVALLNRVNNRVPMTHVLRKSVKSLLADPTLSTYLKNPHGIVKRSLEDQGIEARVMALLSKDIIDWNVLLDARPFNLCENPRKCLNDLLNTVLGAGPKNVSVSRMARYRNVSLCPKTDLGTPLSVWLENLNTAAPNEVSSEMMNGVSAILGNVTMNGSDILGQLQPLAQRMYDTKKDLLTDVLKKMLTLKRVQATPVVYYEAVRLLCVLAHNTNMRIDKLITDTTLDAPPPTNITGNILGNVSLPVTELLNDKEFMKNLSGIKPEDYLSKRLLLIALFKRMLTFESIENKPLIYNEIIRLLHSIQILMIRFDELAKVLVIESIQEGEWSNFIIGFLSQPNLLTILGEDFNIGLYHSKGMMLKAILEQALNVNVVKNDRQLYQAIEAMIHKVDCSHHGAEAVDTIHGEGIMSYAIDFYKLMDSAIDKTKMTPEVEDSFTNMYNWYEGTFNPLRYVSDLNVTMYNTRAEFLNGFFDTLANTVDRNTERMKMDIEKMKSAVLMTGSGAEPVDYV